MKKYFLLAAAAATVLAVSCNKEKNQPKVDPTPNVVDEIDDTTPQPVLFGVSNAVVKSPVSTKAAIDDWSASETLYIYGIQNNEAGTVLIDNVAATSPAAGNTTHAPINVYNPAGGENEPFYYGMNDEVYNFYGYYVADAWSKEWKVAAEPAEPVTYTYAAIAEPGDKPAPGEGYSLPVYINGSQDIMLAQTNKEADWELNTRDVAPSLIYSAKAARRGVHPDLIFKHQLSRFVFKLKAATSVVAQKMDITSLSIASPYYCTLDIDAGSTVFSTPDGLPETMDFEVSNVTEGPAYAVDLTETFDTFADVMVAPGLSTYNIKIKFVYNNISASLPAFERAIDLKKLMADDNYVAEAGKKYVVNIIMYGPEEVKIFVTLAEWDEVLDAEIDPDADEDEDESDTRESLAFSVDLPDTQVLAPGATYDLPAFTIKQGDETLEPQPEVTYTFVPGTATGTTWDEVNRKVTAGTTAGEATLTISVAGTFTTKPLTKTITFTVSE